MADIKINLLPWREEQREEKKKEFLNVLVGIVVVAGVLIFAVDRYYNNSIDGQKSRNRFIGDKIAVLEDKISEIKTLEEERRQLLERRRVIEELQGNRPIIVRLFDELARQMNDDVFFREVTLAKKKLTLQGVAESNSKIAEQLRKFTVSDWFQQPNVTAINADTSFGPKASKFALTVQQSTPTDTEVE
ncbi:MAG: PilN domain-containing protein [Pseudomonadales bacterium]|nr:PilN domain-containing protein [Pseudomonadales bacterium]